MTTSPDLHVFSSRLNARQHPVHLAHVGKLENHLIDDLIRAIVRDTGVIAVSGGICGMKRLNKTPAAPRDPPRRSSRARDSRRHRDHRVERVVSVARGKFIFHVIVPPARQRLLRACETRAGKIARRRIRDCANSQAPRRERYSAHRWFARRRGSLRVIMNRHQRIPIERSVNRRLRFRRTKFVLPRHVQQQWTR